MLSRNKNNNNGQNKLTWSESLIIKVINLKAKQKLKFKRVLENTLRKKKENTNTQHQEWEK